MVQRVSRFVKARPRAVGVSLEFLDNDRLSLLPVSARILAVGLAMFAGGRGIGVYRPSELRQVIFRSDPNRFDEAFDALADAGFVALDGDRFSVKPWFCSFPASEPAVSRRERDLARRSFKRSPGQPCHYCGRPVVWGSRGPDGGTVDHVDPICAGGTSDPTNLVAACKSCNSRKGGRTPEQAGMARP
jgi:hypothetical protein